LILIYHNLYVKGIGNFGTEYFWSSTEDGASYAFAYQFYGPNISGGQQFKGRELYYARAIRAF